MVLPKFNGEDVLQFMCTNPSLVKVPVMILSTNPFDVAHEPAGTRPTALLKVNALQESCGGHPEVLADAAAQTASPAADQN